MSELTIITNNVPRDVVDAWELTADERAEFDYLPWDAIEKGEDSASFVRYKGELIDLGEFTHAGPWNLPNLATRTLRTWDGYRSDSFFSGILICYASDNGRPDWDRVIVGRYYS